MSAPKFTPGPWSFCPATMYRGDLGQAYDICTGGIPRWDRNDFDRDEGVLGLWDFPEGWVRLGTTSDMGPEAKANAALIAAAPDLYSALEASLARLMFQIATERLLAHTGDRDHHLAFAAELEVHAAVERAALAKARGEVRP